LDQAAGDPAAFFGFGRRHARPNGNCRASSKL
jgi:hypothetical protein